MQGILRCRNLFIIRNSLNLTSTQFASIHSTPPCNDKRKINWKSDTKKSQQPSKSTAKYTSRQKRADTKKALKSLLYHYGDLGTTFVNDEQTWRVSGTKSCDTDPVKKGRSKLESKRAQKVHNHKMRRKFRKGYMFDDNDDDDDYSENFFHAKFGEKSFTWGFGRSSRRSTAEFDWREAFFHAKCGQEERQRVNKPDSEDETCNLGLPSDRALLGLPRKGPLKMQDVKTAFHSSALKWHPDKHQGPSQASAEEKFKLCMNAYKSLCTALSGA